MRVRLEDTRILMGVTMDLIFGAIVFGGGSRAITPKTLDYRHPEVAL